MKIAFVWQGSSDTRVFNQWNDGLRQAMRIIEREHEVQYFEPWDELTGDIVLYWEAPCTVNGPNAEHYKKVARSNIRKMLLFAGGPVQKDWVEPFEHVFVESKINADEFDGLGVKNSTAFGINDEIFKPENQPKVFDGMHHATCASWKRQWLLGEALGRTGVICGRYQEFDRRPFDDCKRFGSLVLPNLPAEGVAALLNASHTLVQTSDVWGGGQRATLEAMACNIPVICMEDSPKNREYVEESGFGAVVSPGIEQIRIAVERLKNWTPEEKGNRGREYVESKWTAKHYADNILKVITQI